MVTTYNMYQGMRNTLLSKYGHLQLVITTLLPSHPFISSGIINSTSAYISTRDDMKWEPYRPPFYSSQSFTNNTLG